MIVQFGVICLNKSFDSYNGNFNNEWQYITICNYIIKKLRRKGSDKNAG